MAASKGTFETIRDLISSGNIDQSNVDLLMLAGMADIKDELDSFMSDINKNYVRRDEKREEEQREINDKVKKMWGIYTVQLWMAGIIGANIIALIWALITDKITIVAIP